MSTKIELKCKNCGKLFYYYIGEYNRQTKKGRDKDNFFCSRSCSISHRNKNMSDEMKERISETTKARFVNYIPKTNQFKHFLNKARGRSKDGWAKIDLDLEYLENLWKRQYGMCAISGITLEVKTNKKSLTMASLDRIDSSLGYVKGNVQFVAYGINLAKNTFTNKEMMDFVVLLRGAQLMYG
ncbi:MAG: hypothetical protein P4L79_10415 [Legionella sp.]|uniref:hypothetical protein n=1 Tax=Legionella sp. TaxID=459 RepID=UPI00284F9C03|nr:hypothetical protein [Legionella sp.]